MDYEPEEVLMLSFESPKVRAEDVLNALSIIENPNKPDWTVFSPVANILARHVIIGDEAFSEILPHVLELMERQTVQVRTGKMVSVLSNDAFSMLNVASFGNFYFQKFTDQYLNQANEKQINEALAGQGVISTKVQHAAKAKLKEMHDLKNNALQARGAVEILSQEVIAKRLP